MRWEVHGGKAWWVIGWQSYQGARHQMGDEDQADTPKPPLISSAILVTISFLQAPECLLGFIGDDISLYVYKFIYSFLFNPMILIINYIYAFKYRWFFFFFLKKISMMSLIQGCPDPRFNLHMNCTNCSAEMAVDLVDGKYKAVFGATQVRN